MGEVPAGVRHREDRCLKRRADLQFPTRTIRFVARSGGPAGLRGARFQAVFGGSGDAGIGWNLWGTLPHLLPQESDGDRFGLGRYHEGMAHATKADEAVVKRRREAAEQMRGMFAHVAPGVSLADELIADRRAEVRAEERAEAERRRASG